jgi:Uma2 family endonuclease
MAAPVYEHVVPWTEEEYFALGETADRVELFDGGLLVSPAPTIRHQDLSARLRDALLPAARNAGLAVYLAVNVRLRPGRVPIPDLVITEPVPLDTLVVEAAMLRLVCEITSTNAANDRVLKMHYYAAAGIPWYLLVDPDPLVLRLYRLDGDRYVEHSSAKFGEALTLTEPVDAVLDTSRLGG